MGNDIVRIVEDEINRDRCCEHTRHSSKNEVRNGADTEQHWRAQSDGTVPHRRDPVKRFNRTGDCNGDRHSHKTHTDAWVDPRRKHMVSPHSKREDTKCECGVDDIPEPKYLPT